VLSVQPGTRAAEMGLATGDRILRINGRELINPIVFDAVYSALRGGDTVRLEVLRNGKTFDKQATLPELPLEKFPGIDVRYGTVKTDAGYRVRTVVTRAADARGRLPGIFLAPWLSCDSIENPFGPGSDGMMALLHALAKDSGYVLMRVDPPGRGDSEGPTCSESDFATELAGLRAAFRSFARSEDVDPQRILILGMSNGAGYAPLVAEGAKVAGYTSTGGWSKTWFEHMLEFERRRMMWHGARPGEITAKMSGYSEFYADYLIRKQTPGEVIRVKPQFAAFWSDEPAHQYGRPAAYFQQLQDLNLAAAWENVDAPVLAIWGGHDWTMSREDHEALAQFGRPGLSRFVELPRTTHGLRQNVSDEKSFTNLGMGSFNQSIVPLILNWMKGVAASK
jgi:pimeloyl-ACP methyl ester carboxylesterase